MIRFSSRKLFGCSFAAVLAFSGLGLLPMSAQAIAIREATIRSVRCISPSSGINNVSRSVAAAIGATVGVVTATVATGASGGVLIGTYGIAIVGGASTGVAAINGLDGVFSGTDDLYVRVGGNKVWPSGSRSTEVRSQQTVMLNHTTPLTRPTPIELMEYDSVSDDDSLGTLMLRPEQLPLPGGRQWVVSGVDGSSYEISIEFGVADEVGSQLNSDAANGFSASIANTVVANNGIFQSGSYLRSEDGRYRLVMQGDGNLVMYDNSSDASIWASNTGGSGEGPFRAVVQNDGNFVIYDGQNKSIWATGTNLSSSGLRRLVLQNDRNLVLYDANNRVLWNSATNN